jgi:hypothetical protein
MARQYAEGIRQGKARVLQLESIRTAPTDMATILAQRPEIKQWWDQIAAVRRYEQIKITLRDFATGNLLPVYIDVADNSLSRRWLTALNELLQNNYHLEKNYCWFGWHNGPRTAEYICDQINQSIAAINSADMGYQITDHFDTMNTITAGACRRWPAWGQTHT